MAWQALVPLLACMSHAILWDLFVLAAFFQPQFSFIDVCGMGQCTLQCVLFLLPRCNCYLKFHSCSCFFLLPLFASAASSISLPPACTHRQMMTQPLMCGCSCCNVVSASPAAEHKWHRTWACSCWSSSRRSAACSSRIPSCFSRSANCSNRLLKLLCCGSKWQPSRYSCMRLCSRRGEECCPQEHTPCMWVDACGLASPGSTLL